MERHLEYENKKTACAYYEVNAVELAEHKANMNALPPANRARYVKMDEHIASMDTVCVDCGEFCKHLTIDEGPLYETIYRCTAPGNEHIIGAESDDEEERFEM